MIKYIADGDTLDYTASSAIDAGDVVEVGTLIGVAIDDIASGATGVLQITGVVELAKQATLAITQGALVYWDDAASEIDTTNTNTLAGKCYAAAGASDTTVKVILNI